MMSLTSSPQKHQRGRRDSFDSKIPDVILEIPAYQIRRNIPHDLRFQDS